MVGKVFPGTGEGEGGETEIIKIGRVGQIDDGFAIDVIGTDRERLRLEWKTLLGFEPGGLHAQ
ncbi:hypothetical protein GLI01_20870 [Gluconacetobacter liquefaciens]|nr:hypothetical protein GLI01_20870 [Gluconacetobacter liquefaciens]